MKTLRVDIISVHLSLSLDCDDFRFYYRALFVLCELFNTHF
jgi:hypothetical protein